MPESHPSPAVLERFVLGDLDPAHAAQVVEHLLEECEVCSGSTRRYWQRMTAGLRARPTAGSEARAPRLSPYAEAIERAVAAAGKVAAELGRERAEAAVLAAELTSRPHRERHELVQCSRRYRSRALAELLIARSFELRFSRLQESVELAETAVAVAERLDEASYGSRQIRACQGRAWAYLGNARRIVSDHDGAERALAEARQRFRDADGDPLDRALMGYFTALLLRAQRRLDRSQRLLAKAAALYQECGEPTRTAEVLIDQAVAFQYSGRPERAIAQLEAALLLVDEPAEPRLAAVIRHNIAHCLIDLGHYESALALVAASSPTFRQLDDRTSLLRCRWLEAKILHGLGRLDEAQQAFREVRDGFMRDGVAYDAALACLDLIAIHASKGETAAIRRLAGQIFHIFQSRGVHREALAALTIFRQAVEAERVTVALVRQLIAYLEKARQNSELRFRPAPEDTMAPRAG